jgi:hypothetical protein
MFTEPRTATLLYYSSLLSKEYCDMILGITTIMILEAPPHLTSGMCSGCKVCGSTRKVGRNIQRINQQ